MNNVGYIGYRYKPNTIGFGEATIATGGAALPITAIIDGAVAVLPFLIPFLKNVFQHPARDTKNLINALKPQLQSKDARERLGLVIATGEKISDQAKDVEAKDLLLWYRQTYPNDYQTLLFDDKVYFNNYLMSLKSRFADGNNMYANLDRSMFTNQEVNYKANPIQNITNIVSNKNNLLLYGGIALALLLLLKK